jgi:RNA polymerase-binding transcription factor DksA
MTEHYADTADEADRIFSAIHEKRIALIRESAKRIDTSNPSGDCWHCGAYIGTYRRFCARECADGWEGDKR